MSGQIRTGVCGLGKMGILHSSLIKMIPESELVAVQDVNPKLAKYVRNAGIDVTFYSSVERMLEDTDLQAVLICTPPYAHYDIAVPCVKRGVHVFVEKPLAESLSSAKKMVSLLREKTLVNATGFTIAHIPLFRKAASLLEEGILGTVSRFTISAYISQVFSKKKGWFFDKSKSGGGVIIDIASHLLYLTLWYFGLPQQVFARTLSFHSDVEDSGTICLDYGSGLKGTLDANWSLPGYRQTTMEILLEGEKGTAEITNDYIKLHLLKRAENIPAGWTTFHRIDIGSTSQFDLGSDGFYDEDSHFITCCLQQKASTVTWLDGLYVQSIIDAAYRSSESGHAESLDLSGVPEAFENPSP